MKLTEAQRKHLRALAACGRRSAYPGLRLNTLKALYDRKLVAADYGTLGVFFSPQTAIKFWITPAGRAALAEKDKANER